MLDLYIQITVALLLAFLLGFLIARMWVQNRQNEYIAKFTQLDTKLNTEKIFREQQTQRIELLQDREKTLVESVDELVLIKTSLNIEVTALNKNIEDKENEYLENLTQLENKLNITEKQLEIAYTDNDELTVNLQLATEKQHGLNSQIQILSENYENILKTVAFMEEQASAFAIQQEQFQQSLQQSTQQYASMDEQINTLRINEKEALEKIHDMENKYLDLQTESQSIEDEKRNYCDKLAIATHEKIELEAHTIVRNHTFGAISIAIIPIPFIDLATLLGIQIKMLRVLAEKYEINFSENKVKSLVLPLLSSTLTMTGTIVFSSLIKIIPGIGQASGMVSFSILAGAMTYAVGEVFIEHFESGGTFLDFDIEKQKVRFMELYKKGKEMLLESEEDAS